MDIYSITQEQVRRCLPKRNADTHKGNYGRILLLCGSRGYTGAATLAAMGALRSGAGVVYLGVPESIYTIMAIKLTEPVVIPLPDRNGMLAREATKVLLTLLPKIDAVLIGPGLGQSEDVREVVVSLLKSYTGPIILDADGINVLKNHMDILQDRTEPTILTPHMGEYRRICPTPMKSREESAMEFAMANHCILVLKGHETLSTDGKTLIRNTTGNPGMATGGTGDVLAGMIVSLLGQGIPPLYAAACGTYLHGQAGDICADEIGEYSMLPQDMLNVLPRLFK